MINFEFISKVLVIKIEHFVNCLVQNNLSTSFNEFCQNLYLKYL